jgi:hypothetical protein
MVVGQQKYKRDVVFDQPREEASQTTDSSRPTNYQGMKAFVRAYSPGVGANSG